MRLPKQTELHDSMRLVLLASVLLSPDIRLLRFLVSDGRRRESYV